MFSRRKSEVAARSCRARALVNARCFAGSPLTRGKETRGLVKCLSLVLELLRRACQNLCVRIPCCVYEIDPDFTKQTAFAAGAGVKKRANERN